MFMNDDHGSEQFSNEDPGGDTPQNQSAVLNPLEVRQRVALSEGEMADLMGMSLNGYQQWESGRRRPGGPAFKLLALLATDAKWVIDRLDAAATR